MNNCSFSPFRGKRKADNNDIIRYRIKSIKLRLLDLNGSAPNLLKFKMKILWVQERRKKKKKREK